MLNYNEFLTEGLQEVKKLISNQYKTKNIHKVLFDDDDKILKRLISLDPTSKLNKDKTGKYSKWLVKLWVNNDETVAKTVRKKNKEDDYKIYDVINIFDKNKKKIEKNNIFDYKSFEELEDVVMEFSAGDIGNLDDGIQDDVKSGDIRVFFNNDKWLVVIPHNKRMACKYGVGTKWCTAKEEHNAWDSYDDDLLYIFLDKESNLKPTYQFHFKQKQFMNVKDHSINVNDFFNNNIDVFDKFYPSVKDKLGKEEDLTSTELMYLPKKYMTQLLTYYKNNLLDVLTNDIEILADGGVNQKTLVGFDDYEVEIVDEYLIKIKGFGLNELEERMSIDIDIFHDFHENNNQGQLYSVVLDQFYGENTKDLNSKYLDDTEQVRLLNDILDDNLKEKFSKMCDLAGLIVKLNQPVDYYRTLGALNALDRYEAEVYDVSIIHRADHLSNTLEAELNDIPFFIEHGVDGCLEFDVSTVSEYILRHTDKNILSLEKLLDVSSDACESVFTNDNYYGVVHSTEYESEPLKEALNEVIDDIIEDLEDYGEDSEYLIGNKEIIETLNYLREKNLKVGDKISKENKQITIEKILDDGKLEITIQQGVKTSKHQIHFNDMETYIQNYQLHMERIYTKFNDFLSEGLLKGKSEKDVEHVYKFNIGDLVLVDDRVGLIVGTDYDGEYNEISYNVFMRNMGGDIILTWESDIEGVWECDNDTYNDLESYKSIAAKNNYKINLPSYLEDGYENNDEDYDY